MTNDIASRLFPLIVIEIIHLLCYEIFRKQVTTVSTLRHQGAYHIISVLSRKLPIMLLYRKVLTAVDQQNVPMNP